MKLFHLSFYSSKATILQNVNYMYEKFHQFYQVLFPF